MAIKKVLVTGSNGGIGKVIVRELLEHGYQVTGADIVPWREAPVRTYITNFEDLGQTYGLVQNHDAVIHMAAIPSPSVHAPEVVFRTNVMSTFNVFEAATVLGIQKVVTASSLSALGTAYHFNHIDPAYFPIDESVPNVSQDAYGLSKMIGEELADGFIRRTPTMSISSLRFTAVFTEGTGEHIKQQRKNPGSPNAFWTYIDVRDAALVSRLAMEYTTPGHEAYYITAPETHLDLPTLDLIKQYYPGTKQLDEARLQGSASPVDCSKAERQLGFTPRYLWDGSLRPGA